MKRRLTRRATLAAVGTLAVAGCTDTEPRFWDDPPSLNTTGIARELEAPVPDHPRLVPVSFEPEVAAQFVDRVERLLDPIPDPLSADALPNGAIRDRIRSERRSARATLPRSDEPLSPLRLAERLATARGHAATAVGTWAAVTTEGDPEAVTDGNRTVGARTGRLLDGLPDVAADPIEGAAVYGPIERWLDVAQRRTLVGSYDAVADRADPLRTGDTVGRLERIQSYVDAGRYLRDRYRGSLATARDVEAALRAETTRLGRDLTERLRELHDDGTDRLYSHPGTDAFLSEEPVARGAPIRLLLRRAAGDTFEDVRFDPLAIDGHRPDHPATGLCRSALATARLHALDVVASWIEDGETLFPEDGAAVGAAREAAIDAVTALTAAPNGLARWFGTQLVPSFAEPDAELGATAPETRTVARAFTTYRWIETVATEAAAVSQAVAASIDD